MSTLEQQEIATLKGRVSRLEARLEYLYKHFGVTFVEDTRLTDDPKVIAALKANNMMEAIKVGNLDYTDNLTRRLAGFSLRYNCPNDSTFQPYLLPHQSLPRI